MSQPIVFMIEVTPLHTQDLARSTVKVAEVFQELREDGVQVRRLHVQMGEVQYEVVPLAPAGA